MTFGGIVTVSHFSNVPLLCFTQACSASVLPSTESSAMVLAGDESPL